MHFSRSYPFLMLSTTDFFLTLSKVNKDKATLRNIISRKDNSPLSNYDHNSINIKTFYNLNNIQYKSNGAFNNSWITIQLKAYPIMELKPFHAIPNE